jgi:hypothetical protein
MQEHSQSTVATQCEGAASTQQQPFRRGSNSNSNQHGRMIRPMFIFYVLRLREIPTSLSRAAALAATARRGW